MVYVVNAVGTSDLKCPKEYESWLDFWEKKTRNRALYCKRCSANQSKDLCGGHVQLVEKRIDGKWYRLSQLFITPICAKCNHPENDKIFQVEMSDLIKVYKL